MRLYGSMRALLSGEAQATMSKASLRYPQRHPPRGRTQTLVSQPLPRTSEDLRLLGIAASYFARVARYDSEVCSAVTKGRLCPATEQERRYIDEYAEYVIYDLCLKNGLSRLELLEAIRCYAREVLHKNERQQNNENHDHF